MLNSSGLTICIRYRPCFTVLRITIEQNSCVIVKLYANFGGIDDLSKLGKEIYLISKTVRFLAHPVYSTMKTEDAEALGRQRAKPSKIKAGYS